MNTKKSLLLDGDAQFLFRFAFRHIQNVGSHKSDLLCRISKIPVYIERLRRKFRKTGCTNEQNGK